MTWIWHFAKRYTWGCNIHVISMGYDITWGVLWTGMGFQMHSWPSAMSQYPPWLELAQLLFVSTVLATNWRKLPAPTSSLVSLVMHVCTEVLATGLASGRDCKTDSKVLVCSWEDTRIQRPIEGRQRARKWARQSCTWIPLKLWALQGKIWSIAVLHRSSSARAQKLPSLTAAYHMIPVLAITSGVMMCVMLCCLCMKASPNSARLWFLKAAIVAARKALPLTLFLDEDLKDGL